MGPVSAKAAESQGLAKGWRSAAHITPPLCPSLQAAGEEAGLACEVGDALGPWGRVHLFPTDSVCPEALAALGAVTFGVWALWEEGGPLALLATAAVPSEDGEPGHGCGLDKPSQSIPCSPLQPQAR